MHTNRYGITINPRIASYNELRDFRSHIKYLKHFKRYCTQWIVFPELSRTGKLHYHGTFTATTRDAGRILRYMSHRIGFSKLEFLDTPKRNLRFSMYCRKQWHTNQYIFDNYICQLNYHKWQPRKYRILKQRPRQRTRRVHPE